jgi:hypothetical protein
LDAEPGFSVYGRLLIWVTNRFRWMNQIGAVVRLSGVMILTFAMISYHLPAALDHAQILAIALTTLFISLIFAGMLVY